jgi:hypothetical protein
MGSRITQRDLARRWWSRDGFHVRKGNFIASAAQTRAIRQ